MSKNTAIGVMWGGVAFATVFGGGGIILAPFALVATFIMCLEG